MHHYARLGGEFLDGDAEFAGRIVEQHPAHLRAELAQRRVIARHRAGTGLYIMPWKPGLPYTASTAGAGTMRTFDQSASSSSAMMSGTRSSTPAPSRSPPT